MVVSPSGVLTGLALCAGVGGLELGLHLALGGRYRGLCYVERDASAAAFLATCMEQQTLAPAPIWDDLRTFSCGPWRGRVAVVSAGFPCQPHSQAGERRGIDDERWVWPDIARILREVGPRFVFLENVPGLLSSGVEHVFGDLAALGYRFAWDVFSAAETGAPHLRERLFILADAGRGLLWDEPIGGTERTGAAVALDGWATLVDTDGEHGSGQSGGDAADLAESRGSGPGRVVANADGIEGWQRPEPDEIGRRADEARQAGMGGGGSDLPYWTPARDDRDGWRAVLDRWPELRPALEPPVRRVADGLPAGLDEYELADRTARLSALGNGVVPVVAAHAFRVLFARLNGWEE